MRPAAQSAKVEIGFASDRAAFFDFAPSGRRTGIHFA